MNRNVTIFLLMLGMVIGAAVIGPTAKYLLTDAQAQSGSLTNFTVETDNGLVALYVTRFYNDLGSMFLPTGWYDRTIVSIDPNPEGNEFKVVLILGRL